MKKIVVQAQLCKLLRNLICAKSMHNNYEKYISFFRLRFTMGLQYRVAALAGIATQFTWGFLEILIFQAFYQSEPEAFPMSMSATASYIWLQQAFLAFFATWQMENEIFDSIVNGNISYSLCRPIRIYNMWFSQSMASRVSRAVLRCLPILAVAAFLPESYQIAKPESALHFALFLITLLLGLLVTVAFCMLIYVMTFFTISPMGLRMVCTSMVEFFAGAIIPLPFFPENWRRIMELLPFASMQNVALRIYSGSMSGAEMQNAILIQTFWLIALTLSGSLLCRYAERKVSIQGG